SNTVNISAVMANRQSKPDTGSQAGSKTQPAMKDVAPVLGPALNRLRIRDAAVTTVIACYRGDRPASGGFMLARIVFACLLAAVPIAGQPFDTIKAVPSAVERQQEQEKPKPVPKDSIRVDIIGCVKGRVI